MTTASTESRENATNVPAGRVRPVAVAAVYGALPVLCMLAVLAANALLLYVVSPESPAEVTLVLVVAGLSLAAFPFLVRAARRPLPAPRTRGAVAAEIAGTLLAILLPALLLFAAGRADAQQMPGGMQVEDGRVEIGGPQVLVEDGCVKVGNIEVGDCEDGRGHGSLDGNAPDAAGGPDSSSDRPTDQTGGECEPDEALSGEETTAPDATAADPSLPEAGCEEGEKNVPKASGEENTGEETDGGATPETTPLETTAPGTPRGTSPGTPPTQETGGCPVDGPPEDALAVTVETAVDGDTLEISEEVRGTDTVRLIGVDTPETVAPDEDDEPFGEEASAFTREALEREEVFLELGEDEEDQYGRLLAYAWDGEELFNETLLERGYAEALAVDPNTKYRRCFEAAERWAREHGRGLWGLALDTEDDGLDPTAAEDRYAPPDRGVEETTAPAPEPSSDGGKGPWGLLRNLLGVMSEEDAGPNATVLEKTVVQRQSEERAQESTGGSFGQELTETDTIGGTSPSSAAPDDVSSASPDDGAFGLQAQPVTGTTPTATASPGADGFQYGPEAPAGTPLGTPTATPTPGPQDTLTVLPDTGGPVLERLMLLLPAGIALLAGGSVVLGILYKTDPHAGDDEDRG